MDERLSPCPPCGDVDTAMSPEGLPPRESLLLGYEVTLTAPIAATRDVETVSLDLTRQSCLRYFVQVIPRLSFGHVRFPIRATPLWPTPLFIPWYVPRLMPRQLPWHQRTYLPRPKPHVLENQGIMGVVCAIGSHPYPGLRQAKVIGEQRKA